MSDKKLENMERRRFLHWLWMLPAAAGLVEVFGSTAFVLKSRTAQAADDKNSSMVQAGKVDDFKPGSVTDFQQGEFYLVRLDDGGFLALSRKCTHRGCAVPWNAKDQKFICPCHASEFDITGNVVKSPASRALDLHPVTIEDGTVLVDANRRIKRNQFKPDQAVRPR